MSNMEHVIVTGYGSFISKTSERLVVKTNKQIIQEIPFFDVEQLTVASKGVSLSAEVVRACAEAGISITFLSGTGKPYALLHSPNITGTATTRREQYKSLEDKRGVNWAKEILKAKVHNQASLLKYAAKYRKGKDVILYGRLMDLAKEVEAFETAIGAVKSDCINPDTRAQLMSLEAHASKKYWEGFEGLLKDKTAFVGREQRGASDLVNSLLNYGYGILYNQVHCAVLLSGLEPFAGFLHVDRPGKHSLVLDMVEEFRQPVVDRTVLAFINKGEDMEMDGDRLPDAARKEFAEKVRERLESTERWEGKKLKIKTIIERQARHLATYLRGEGKYRALRASW